MVLAIQAPAKLNRYLAVLGRRPDGFHELELVTTLLEGVPELMDTLSGKPSAKFSLTLSGPMAGGLAADDSNLVIQAWHLLEQAAELPLPATLHLEKRIPHGAGLGGGSSDAAAALRLGNQLFDLGLADSDLLDMAVRLGSDVPLFLLGGTSLGLGRGERVYPLRPIPLEPMLVVHPGLHVSTPEVYRALQAVGYPSREPLRSLPEGSVPPWENDLTEAALLVCPSLSAVRDGLAATGGYPLLCGSGSSWAARYAHPSSRDAAADRIQHWHPEWRVWVF